jgi:hypothetical protein
MTVAIRELRVHFKCRFQTMVSQYAVNVEDVDDPQTEVQRVIGPRNTQELIFDSASQYASELANHRITDLPRSTAWVTKLERENGA